MPRAWTWNAWTSWPTRHRSRASTGGGLEAGNEGSEGNEGNGRASALHCLHDLNAPVLLHSPHSLHPPHSRQNSPMITAEHLRKTFPGKGKDKAPVVAVDDVGFEARRSEEHPSELQSLMRITYAAV